MRCPKKSVCARVCMCEWISVKVNSVFVCHHHWCGTHLNYRCSTAAHSMSPSSYCEFHCWDREWIFHRFSSRRALYIYGSLNSVRLCTMHICAPVGSEFALLLYRKYANIQQHWGTPFNPPIGRTIETIMQIPIVVFGDDICFIEIKLVYVWWDEFVVYVAAYCAYSCELPKRDRIA